MTVEQHIDKLSDREPKTTPTVANFWLQPTASFPDGAPQREEYWSDSAHLRACNEYGAEWRQEYICANKDCKNRDCPQHRLDKAPSYPETPGFKEKGGTSEAAAKATETRVEYLRRRVKEVLRVAERPGLTADETANIVGETPFSMRPRFTELLHLGEIEKTGTTRRNASGHPARVWRLTVKQGELFG